MVSEKIMITSKLGLHARPASNFVKECTKFNSEIKVLKGTKVCNGKSMLSILSACIKCGEEIELICEGPDEEQAIKAITQAVAEGLGE